jgi:glycosyltransferase involved in cell wall biosynthesis
MLLQGKKKVNHYYTEVPNKPLVSVCIQTYKHEEYIKECLDSILMQKTTFDFEILLGEDDSPDDTRSICIEYAKKYPQKIRLFLHGRSNVIFINNKPTGRYNFIYNLQASNGKYIALCEGDDYWVDEHKLQKQVEQMEKNHNLAICFHNVNVSYEEKEEKSLPFHKKSLKKEFDFYDILKGNFINTCSVLYRNNQVDFPLFFMTSPVGDWILHILNAHTGKIHYIDEVLAVYRIHDGGIYQHHYNWSYERTVRNQEQFIKLRLELKKLFASDAKAQTVLDDRVNQAYLDLIIAALKNNPIQNWFQIKEWFNNYLNSKQSVKRWAKFFIKTPIAFFGGFYRSTILNK